MARNKPIEMIGDQPASVVRGNCIFDVKTAVKDGSDWIVRCPHCRQQITLDGGQGDIRGEQFQHKRTAYPGPKGPISNGACGGWFQVTSTARLEL